MRKILIILLLFLPVMARSQKSSELDAARQQRAAAQKKIEESERLLKGTEKDLTGQLSLYNTITALLKEKRTLLAKTRSEVTTLTRQSEKLSKELKSLENELVECKETYATACRFFQHQQTSLNPLQFLFSSENFNQMLLRSRYISEYQRSLVRMGADLSAKQDSVMQRRSEIEKLKTEKLALQQSQQEQEQSVAREEQRQAATVKSLRSKRTALKKEITEQQKREDALEKEINRLIKAEQEARKKKTISPKEEEATVKLTGNFKSNKGMLPVPIRGSYLVVENYGRQPVAGQSDLRKMNYGIVIKGDSQADVLSVFDGTVSSVFRLNSYSPWSIIVNHGNYSTVYSNLSRVQVSVGESVKTGQTIGAVMDDGLLNFKVKNGETTLNPREWLLVR